MAKFKWDSATISGNQIAEVLYDQYGSNNQIAVTIPDMEKRINYTNSLVSFKCNRCGSTFSMSPKMALESVNTKGYVCSECGPLTSIEVRERRLEQMKEDAVRLAKEKGIDLDELERKKEEEQQEKESLKYTKEDIESMNEEISEEDIDEEISESTESSDALIDEENSLSEDDTSKYMYDEEEDSKLSLEDAISETNEYDEDYDEDFDEDFDNDSETKDVEDDVETIVEEERPEESEEDVSDEDVEESVEEEIDPEESFLVGNKRMTPLEAQTEFQKEIDIVTKEVGSNPYERNVSTENNSIKVLCNVCNKEFLISDPNELHEKITVLTKKYCVARGITYKAPFGKEAKLYYCPHCMNSVMTLGYNKYIREGIEQFCKAIKLNIVNIEKYWFANFDEEIIVEANGITKQMRLRDILDKYDKVKDVTKLKEFEPLGDKTKSSTDEETTKANESYNPKATTETASSGFKINKQMPFNGTATDSNEKLNKEFEEENASVKDNSVFHVRQSIKDKYSNVAKINSRLNPFSRNKSLESAFQKSEFAQFISELSDETHVKCTLSLNAKTFEIPIIDFENGYRIICVDIDDNSMTKIPYNTIANSIPFTYKREELVKDEFSNKLVRRTQYINDYKCLILFSDSINKRHDATLDALIKFINPKVLPYKGKAIDLSGSEIKTYYTDYKPYLKEFNSEYSTFPAGKPKNGQLGIVANWNESGDDSTIGIRDIMNFQVASQDNNKASLSQLNNDFSQYLVASIKYIERVNKDTGRVVYTITDYLEVGSAILKDGFSQCLRALLKEYSLKYPQLSGTLPHIILEIDSNTFPSPSLKEYIDEGTLCLVDDVYRSLVDGKPYTRRGKESYLKYTYVRKTEYRSTAKDTDWCRQDMRMFGAGTLVQTMADDLKACGITSAITDERTRLAFINNMGFTKNNQWEIKEYFVNQNVIQNYLLDSDTTLLQKLPDPEESLVKSGLVNGSGDGFNINNVMSNPALMNKYMRIMNNSSPEARSYFINNVLYANQNNDPSMVNPMMGMPGMGMNPMMGMNMGMGMPGMQPNPMMGMGMPGMGY